MPYVSARTNSASSSYRSAPIAGSVKVIESPGFSEPRNCDPKTSSRFVRVPVSGTVEQNAVGRADARPPAAPAEPVGERPQSSAAVALHGGGHVVGRRGPRSRPR